MAEVTTSVIIAPTIAPFVTSNIRNVENSGIPFGALSHVHEFDVPAIGTGDVGRLIVYCRVPVNYLTVLNGFHIDQSATSEPKWESGVFKNYYVGANSFTTQTTAQIIHFPLAITSNAGIGSNQYKNVGISNAGSNSAYDVNSPVNFIFKGNELDPNKCPIIDMYNTTEGVHATRFRVAINWKMYDISQGNHPFLQSATRSL